MELLTPDEMAECDRLTVAAGIPGIALMENAGRAVAEAVLRHPPGMRVLVVAGPGNNGGDGFVAARVVAERGYQVRVLLLGEPTTRDGDAAEARRLWRGPIEPAQPEAVAGADVIVDALFGAGLNRPVEGNGRAMIEAMNASGAPIIAVDLPSGIDGATGAVMGAAVSAHESITFFRRKLGHVLLPGRRYAGNVRVADIGISERVLERVRPKAFANGPALWAGAFPIPRLEGHKYSRGHAVILSGELPFTGAARLAARGALRAGAGLVTLASPRGALLVNAVAALAVMVRAADGADELRAMLADRRLNTVVLGPGLGVSANTRALVLAALDGERAIVLDADALTSFAEEPRALFDAIAAHPERQLVLTPHQGEFARLFKGIAKETETQSRLSLARAAAGASGAVVLLKGADTVVAAPNGRAAINENAPPWLATAGSGDVLAGIVGGLLAQHMPAFEAACAGAWLHGEAGNEVGPGLIAEDLPEALPVIYRRLFDEFTNGRAR
ncbi:MAG: NAD(P)H-hydrate dehydratase [Alphaproteobacteria bacterium]|nr:MAG: NAD(P)H-hydrate dehydratase [Alphaproteobacteria bacterium]